MRKLEPAFPTFLEPLDGLYNLQLELQSLTVHQDGTISGNYLQKSLNPQRDNRENEGQRIHFPLHIQAETPEVFAQSLLKYGITEETYDATIKAINELNSEFLESKKREIIRTNSVAQEI